MGVGVRCNSTPKQQTAIVFDWDDTLLCTTYLAAKSKGSRKNDPTLGLKMEQLDDIVSGLLEQALSLGKVFIITNSVGGWVEHSAEQYLEKTSLILRQVVIMSARADHEMQCPAGDYSMWKLFSFTKCLKSKLINNCINTVVTNLISVGDSFLELDAVHALAEHFPRAVVKTIKCVIVQLLKS